MPVCSQPSRFASSSSHREAGSATTPVLALIAIASVALLFFVGVSFFSSDSDTSWSAVKSQASADMQPDNLASGLLPNTERAEARAREALARREANRAARRDEKTPLSRAGANPSSGTGRGPGDSARHMDEGTSSDISDPEPRQGRSRPDAQAANLLVAVAPDAPATDRDKDQGGVTGGAGFQVGQVFEGTPLWDAGVRPGDKIPSVNGEPVSSWDDVIQEVGRTEGPVTLEIVPPGGSPYETSLSPPLCCMTNQKSGSP